MKISSQLNFLALSALCVLAFGLEEVDPKVDSGLNGCVFDAGCQEPILSFASSSSAERCEVQCRGTDQASWFMWNEHLSFCACLESCDEKKNSLNFVSGPLYCSQSGCARNGICSGGKFLQVTEVNSFTMCQESCIEMAEDVCKWFTFNQDNGWCVLYSDCPEIQVRSCPMCVTSSRNCGNSVDFPENNNNNSKSIQNNNTMLIESINVGTVVDKNIFDISEVLNPENIPFDNSDNHELKGSNVGLRENININDNNDSFHDTDNFDDLANNNSADFHHNENEDNDDGDEVKNRKNQNADEIDFDYDDSSESTSTSANDEQIEDRKILSTSNVEEQILPASDIEESENEDHFQVKESSTHTLLSLELDSNENGEDLDEKTFDEDDVIKSSNDVIKSSNNFIKSPNDIIQAPNGVTRSSNDVIKAFNDVTNPKSDEKPIHETIIVENSDLEINEPNVSKIKGFFGTEIDETSREEVLDSKPEVTITSDLFLDRDFQLPEELLIEEKTDYDTDDVKNISGRNSGTGTETESGNKTPVLENGSEKLESVNNKKTVLIDSLTGLGPETPIFEDETGQLDSVDYDNTQLIDYLTGTGTSRLSPEKDQILKESPSSNPSGISIKEIFPEEKIEDKKTRDGRAKKSTNSENLEFFENLKFERKKRSQLLTGLEVADISSTDSEEEYQDLSSIEEQLSGLKTTYLSKSEEDQLDVGSLSSNDFLPEEKETLVDTTSKSLPVFESDQSKDESVSLSPIQIVIEEQNPAEVSNEEKHREREEKLDKSEDDSAFLGGRKNPRFERKKIPNPDPVEVEETDEPFSSGESDYIPIDSVSDDDNYYFLDIQ